MAKARDEADTSSKKKGINERVKPRQTVRSPNSGSEVKAQAPSGGHFKQLQAELGANGEGKPLPKPPGLIKAGVSIVPGVIPGLLRAHSPNQRTPTSVPPGRVPVLFPGLAAIAQASNER